MPQKQNIPFLNSTKNHFLFDSTIHICLKRSALTVENVLKMSIQIIINWMNEKNIWKWKTGSVNWSDSISVPSLTSVKYT